MDASTDFENSMKSMDQELISLLALFSEEATPDAKQNMVGFKALYEQYLKESGSKIHWENIKPPTEGTVLMHSSLDVPVETKAAYGKLAVLKLNGGLGTSMGCEGPKSAIPVRDGMTFLDLCVKQIESLNHSEDVDVPLILMNSFNTHDDTEKIVRKYMGHRCEIIKFNQSRYPRIFKDSHAPVAQKTSADNKDWYPPGHGDLYESLYNSGTLDKLIADGKEYLFVSNIDNLGATVDTTILHHFDSHPECEFIMEVTDKTRADVKGGTLVRYEGVTRLLEVAQVPSEHLEEFKSINKFRIFNTNNLWIKLSAIKRLVEEKALHMEVIENKKVLDGGQAIIQLERAVGSAIKNFQNGIGVNVPRSRFLPVKKTSDLLLVMSNLYRLNNGCLTMNPARTFQNVPLVKLGDENFKKVKECLSRFGKIPDLLELDHLTVTGDVNFGTGITLKGTVIIIANHGERIDIPSGAMLENKIVSGNLRILDH